MDPGLPEARTITSFLFVPQFISCPDPLPSRPRLGSAAGPARCSSVRKTRGHLEIQTTRRVPYWKVERNNHSFLVVWGCSDLRTSDRGLNNFFVFNTYHQWNCRVSWKSKGFSCSASFSRVRNEPGTGSFKHVDKSIERVPGWGPTKRASRASLALFSSSRHKAKTLRRQDETVALCEQRRGQRINRRCQHFSQRVDEKNASTTSYTVVPVKPTSYITTSHTLHPQLCLVVLTSTRKAPNQTNEQNQHKRQNTWVTVRHSKQNCDLTHTGPTNVITPPPTPTHKKLKPFNCFHEAKIY